MQKICGIYKITNPKGKVYIGQSRDVLKRKQRYQYPNMEITKQHKIYNSINKYGWDKHKFEIIHQCKPEELNGLEIYYIELYQCFTGEHGLNLKEGGSNGAVSESTKEKLRKYYRDRPELKPIQSLHATRTLGKYYSTHERPSIISKEQAIIICDEYCGYKKGLPELAKEYGVCISTIHNIVTGKTFPDIKRPLLRKAYKGSGNGSSKFKEPQVIEIRRCFRIGTDTYTDFAKRYNVSYQAIANIINRVTWNHI